MHVAFGSNSSVCIERIFSNKMNSYTKSRRRARVHLKPREKTNAEIKREIEYELECTHLQTQSKQQWEVIVNDILQKPEAETDKDSEWKTRYLITF